MTLPAHSAAGKTTIGVFSTASAAPGGAAAYWNRLINETFSPASLRAADATKFEADLRVHELGSVSIACLNSHPGVIERTQRHVQRGTDKRRFCFSYHTEGFAQRLHRGRDIELHKGDFTLLDNTVPFVTKYQRNSAVLLLNVPGDILETHLPLAEQMCGLALPADARLGGLIGNMMQGLWREVETGLPADRGRAVVEPLLDVVATAYGMTFKADIPGSAVTNAHRTKAKQFIDSNLRNPDLTPDLVAAAVEVTPRYLRMLFASQNETVADYILKRRIEQCARRLADDLWRNQSITDIAFTWGFNSASHFSSVFKKRFDMAPREYRQRHSTS